MSDDDRNVAIDNTDTRYKNALYEDDPNFDPLTQSRLNPEDAPLDAGLADDAFMSFDMDDATLVAENDEDVIATGMDSVDGDNIREDQDKLSDTFVDNIQLGGDEENYEEVKLRVEKEPGLNEPSDPEDFEEDEEIDDDEIDIEE